MKKRAIVKLALIQQSFKGNKKDTVDATTQYIQEAVQNNAQLIVLQELHTREYFCQTENICFFEYAQDFSDDIHYFSSLAQKYSVVLVCSLFEKRAAGLYHNTAVVFEGDGKIAGKYRKMHIPDDPRFYEKFYFTPGDLGFLPIQTSLGKLGVLVCWDQWYPEAARLMALRGAEILIYPTAIGWFNADSDDEKQRQLDAWVSVQRGHAVANCLPVVACNRVGFERDPSNATEGINFWGNSFAFGPQGELLGRLGTKEDILYIDICFQDSEYIHQTWPFLRDRRIDFYAGLTERYLD